MSEILGNVYDRSIAIAFGTAFFVIFGDCGKVFFDEKFFNVLYLYFLFIQKNSRTGSRKTSIVQVIESCPTPR